ncbi:hypothetical protein SFR_4943 [Streptomyces sp. FR-008]|nr:hypothetical protein SFR_4943 [Streptomyces sp. FR-008]
MGGRGGGVRPRRPSCRVNSSTATASSVTCTVAMPAATAGTRLAAWSSAKTHRSGGSPSRSRAS